MASTLSLHEEQAATGRLKRKQTPTSPPADDTLGDDDSSSIPSDDDQLPESLKAEILRWWHKVVVPPGFLAPLSRECRPSALDEMVAPPPRDDGDGNSSPCRVTNSLKRRRSQNDERKNISTCSDNSLHPNIAEELNGHALQKIMAEAEASKKKDPAWKHGVLVDPSDQSTVKCNKVTKGGIHRHKLQDEEQDPEAQPLNRKRGSSSQGQASLIPNPMKAKDAIFGRSRDVPSTPLVVCIDELTQRLEEAEAARHADKEAMQKKYDSIMAAIQKISPRVQPPYTLVPTVDFDEAHQVTNPRKRRRCVKKVSTPTPTTSEDGSSEDSSQLNIAEIRLQKGRHCNNPLNPGSVEPAKNIPSSSEFPSFFISMKSSHVNGGGRNLVIPAEFCKHHLPDKDTTIILKGENGVEYKTTYLSRTSHGSRLSAGWGVFCNDHQLAVGDVLRFQLVNQTKFEVFIERLKQSDELMELSSQNNQLQVRKRSWRKRR